MEGPQLVGGLVTLPLGLTVRGAKLRIKAASPLVGLHTMGEVGSGDVPHGGPGLHLFADGVQPGLEVRKRLRALLLPRALDCPSCGGLNRHHQRLAVQVRDRGTEEGADHRLRHGPALDVPEEHLEERGLRRRHRRGGAGAVPSLETTGQARAPGQRGA